MTPKQRSTYRNGSVQFVHGDGSVKMQCEGTRELVHG